MFKNKLWLALFGVLIFSSLAFGQKALTKSVEVDNLPVVRIDLDTDKVVQSYRLAQAYDEAVVMARIDTVAADSVAFFIVLDVSPNGIQWVTHDSSALNSTADSVLVFKRFTGIGSRYARIRINPTAANSGNPDRPLRSWVVWREKSTR